MSKPKVGQTLYSLNINNAAIRVEQVLTEVVVTKVGRKYFTCNKPGGRDWTAVQYHLEDWTEKTDYCRDTALYTTVQEREDEAEASKLCRQIWKNFEYGTNRSNLLLGDLREICAMLEATDET